MRVFVIILAWSVFAARLVAADASVSGTTWVYVQKWDRTRGDVDPSRYTSPAAVVHFCPNGQFTLLKCMLYHHAHESTTIGSDDGLEIYRGTWSPAASGAVITYHL